MAPPREAWLDVARAAAANLAASRRRIDDLNVYPVPDGDTGTNLALTVQAGVDALEAAPVDAPAPELARLLGRAVLLGARGNSGVILSQIVRGGLDTLAGGGSLAAALAAARDGGYAAVREPVEGTILTMIRELADEAIASAALPAPELLRALVHRGEDALARTPELLPTLREAGVVDAGAAGLLELVRGAAAFVSGEPLPPPPPALERVGEDAIHLEPSRYRYCTVFAVEANGTTLDRGALEGRLAQLGDSLLVVGDATLLKVHVHTDDPGAALSAASRLGVLERVEVANMHRQAEARDERLAHALETANATDVVAVAAGAGNARLLRSLGAAVVVDGATNPSTSELLTAVNAASAPAVLLLPNDPNVILAARHAAELAAKPVRVLPTRSLQEGLAALVAYDAAADADANEAEMAEAAAGAAAGAVTVAARDVELPAGAVRVGEFLGLVAGEPTAGGSDFTTTAAAVVERLTAEPREVLTLLVGAEPEPLEALLALVAERHPGLEVEVHEGGQPSYPLLLSAE